jgi:hypothetical protein
MPLPLALAAPAVLNLVGGTVARQALMTGARSLITRGAGGAGRVLEGEFIAGSRAAGGLFRKNAGDVLEGQVIGGGLLQRLAKNKLAQNLVKGAGYALPFLGNLGRGTAKVAGKIGTGIALGASMLGRLGGAAAGFLGGDNGGQITSSNGVEGASLTSTGGDATAFRGALPTLRTPSMPGLPGFRAKNKTGDCCGQECCEVTNRLLSIAVKYLAGIDATLKNQLDVQRASFTQENQAAREGSLEKETLSGADGGGKIMAMVKNTGEGMLSFLTKTLLMTLALSLPALVKKVTGVFEGIFEIVDDTIDKIKGFLGEEDSAVTPTETFTPKRLGHGRRGRKYTPSAAANADFSGTNFENVKSGIIAGEGTALRGDPYNTVYAYGQYGSPDKPLTEMTLGQVSDFQKNTLIPNTRGKIKGVDSSKGTGAIGAYQFNYGTLMEQAQKLYGDNWKNIKFTPEIQDELAKSLYESVRSNNKQLSGTWAYFRNLDPAGGAALRAQSGDFTPAAMPIAAAAISNAAGAGSSAGSTTPPAVVVASNSPAPSSTSVVANGPGEPSSPYFDSTIMWTNYFTTGRA